MGNIKFYQSSLREILDMGEDMYWSLLKLWDIKREDLYAFENEITKDMTDFDLWKAVMINSLDMRSRISTSVQIFLHTKIEFLPISNTIMIGEDDSPVLLDERFYLSMKEICQSISMLGVEEKDEQYKETENMSAREREIIRKMKASAAKLDRIKNGERSTEDRLVKQIISLVAIGHYTFDEVYEMTIVQLIYLLRKYVEIQQYELYTALSPYIDSKKNQAPKHWLDT